MEVLVEVDTDEDHLEADIAVDRLEVLEDTVEEVVEDTREEVLLLEKEDIAEVLVVDIAEALRVVEAVDIAEEARLDDQEDIAEVLQAVPVDRTEVIEMIVEILRDVHTTHNILILLSSSDPFSVVATKDERRISLETERDSRIRE